MQGGPAYPQLRNDPSDLVGGEASFYDLPSSVIAQHAQGGVDGFEGACLSPSARPPTDN